MGEVALYTDLILARARIAELEAERDALRSVVDAAENLVKVRGRFHGEQAYQRLAAAIAAKEPV